ncbi:MULTISPECIES: flagellar basal body L-ring protein FlgH [unclassified Halomonas]|uniref:flagellar basal body L-ring protein FlgH n=1 Tax=unclassified Halomonas TaxID=2609666 RepID=UPI0007F0529E|nr:MULTISPECIES: flagellar basal body L-ring protein FlgH [unclassified Halomonas]SBR52383.1 flagellar L-ring protein precursor FlgH [Halomonas sp. HL-93]SNY98036.1 flagellar L-ring protein precursor FlgH [Halomonas sp. hl-4]
MLERHCISRRIALAGLVFFLLVVAGCAQIPRASVVGEQEQINIVDRPPPEPNGSIYQARRGYQPLFEDRRPRSVGDILTIVLDEEVSASKNSESNADRDGSAGLEFGALPDALETLAEYGFEVEGQSDFSGGGGSQANNSFTGTITVSVLEVTNNGNLRVRGEKQIAINQGTEFIRFSGVVNPRAITSQNTVPSTQVADARIEYVGDGYINEAQHMGWLQRFFLNVSPF